MKKLALALAAATALSTSAGVAAAQTWMPMIERQGLVEDRIEAGLGSGAMSDAEARMIRSEMYALVAMEGRYRMNGLSWSERRDLDRRFAALDDRIEFAMADMDGAQLASLEDRKLRLDRRIEQGLRSGQLTNDEAELLRDEFDDLATLEARYRVGGISSWERADLDRRMDRLADRIGDERTDPDREYGWSRY
jgi:hypothetical protein